MNKLPWFQFYANDFLGSADVEVMTDAEFRAYVNLLNHHWLLGCRLPHDDRKLMILSRIGEKAWAKARAAVMAKFEDRGDCYVNLKQERQKIEAETFQKSQSDKGKKGAASRWGKNDETIDNQSPEMAGAIPRSSLGMTGPMPERWPEDGSPSSSSLSKETEERALARAAHVPANGAPTDLIGHPLKPERRKTPFVKPTIEQVTAYCTERAKGVDPSKWFNHYTANGWRVGKNPMADWKAAVRTWESAPGAPPSGTNNFGRPTPSNGVPSVADTQRFLKGAR